MTKFFKWRTGNFISRLLRVVFEKPRAKQFLGIGLPLAMILTGPFTSMLAASSVQAQTPPTVITQPEKILGTQHTFQKPVMGNVSQGFHWYHPAVDIADNDGADVHPAAAGKVVEIGYQFWGYGNYVMVQHGETLISLYAHLKSVNVKVGDEVKLDAVLGIVGSTGRSTGPHLHLEIRDGETKLNPFSVIENL